MLQKEDTNKWEDIHVNGLKDCIVKMPILSKVMYRFSVFPIKIPMVSFAEIGKSIVKFIWNLKGPGIAKTIKK